METVFHSFKIFYELTLASALLHWEVIFVLQAMENSLRHCSKETSCNPDEPAHSCAEEIKMESTKHTIYELHGKEGGPSVEPVSSSGEQNKDHDDVIKEAIFKELEQRAAERGEKVV